MLVHVRKYVLHTVVSYFCFQSSQINDITFYKHVLVILQCLNTHRLTLYRIIFYVFLMENAAPHSCETHMGGVIWFWPWGKRPRRSWRTHPHAHTHTHSPAGTLCDNGLWVLRHALGTALWTVALCCTDTSTPGTSTPPHNWNRRKEEHSTTISNTNTVIL